MPWRVREANCELRDAVVNFRTTELHNFISLFESRKLQHNEAELLNRARRCRVRSVKWLTVEKWLERSKPFQIAHQFNLPKKTVANIVDRFVHTSSPYTEFCKQQRPSMYTTEIQKQLIENQVIDPQRFDKLCIDMRFGLLIQKVDNSSKRELII